MGNLTSTPFQQVAAAADGLRYLQRQDKASLPFPSPKECSVTRLTDEGIASFVELPADTFYMESIATNHIFDPVNAYVPAQRYVNDRRETHLYTIRPGISEAEHLFGPIGVFDATINEITTEATIFGSTLSSGGILYLAAWNRNSVLVYDLNGLPDDDGSPVSPLFEIEGLAAPNDVTIDPNDESILYVAGGTLKRFLGCNLGLDNCLKYSNPVKGKIYQVHVDVAHHDYEIKIFSENHLTLSGIQVVGNILWTSQLFDIFVQRKGSQSEIQKIDSKVVWEGIHDKCALSGDTWLADNIDVLDEDYVMIPAFSTAPTAAVEVGVKNTVFATLANFFSQIVTSFQDQDESFQMGLMDPEIDLCFSNTYIQEGEDPAPIRSIFFSSNERGFPSSSSLGESWAENNEQEDPCHGVHHFEVDLVETRANNPAREVIDPETGDILGMRHYFNDQVTHMAQIVSQSNNKSYIAHVNFEQPRILLLDEDAFRLTLRKTVSE